ncbi:MAG: hypothetical protein ACRCV9_09770 [Burkholderiaceae bacterium]
MQPQHTTHGAQCGAAGAARCECPTLAWPHMPMLKRGKLTADELARDFKTTEQSSGPITWLFVGVVGVLCVLGMVHLYLRGWLGL